MSLTLIDRHPKLPDYFQAHGDRLPDAAAAAAAFENGQVMVFDGLPFQVPDPAFLDALVLPPECPLHVKKAKVKHLLTPVPVGDFEPGGSHRHLLTNFVSTLAAAHRFQECVRHMTDQLTTLFHRLFPDYRVVDTSHTWRLTTTESEVMHYDTYGDSTDEHARVRIFYNLDRCPRLWFMTHPVDDAVRIHWGGELARHARVHPNLFNARLNDALPLAKLVRHHVLFAPGAVWVCDSQKVGHEAVWGRRLLAYTFVVDHASLREPAKRFTEVVRRAVHAEQSRV